MAEIKASSVAIQKAAEPLHLRTRHPAASASVTPWLWALTMSSGMAHALR